MFRSLKLRKKLFSLLSLVSFVFNIFQPAFLALTLVPPAFAEEAVTDPTPAPSIEPTQEPSATPTLEPTPTASPIESVAPSPTPTLDPSPSADSSPSPDVSLEPTPSVAPSLLPTDAPIPSESATPTNPPAPADSAPAPPSAESSPTEEPSTSPTATPTPTPVHDEHLDISIFDNTSASSIAEFDLSVNESTSATLITDKADYAPTDTAVITGTGFDPNTTYSLTISSTDDPATSTTANITTDVDGTLFYAYQLDGIYRPNYKVEAYLASSLVASVTFTDSPLPSGGIKVEQWETLPSGNWITGNLGSSNSNYKEGETVPFRLDIGTLATSGNPYTFSICRDYQNGSKKGYYSLLPYNTTKSPTTGGTISATSGPFSGVNISSISATEVGGQGACGAGQRETQVSIAVTSSLANTYLLWGGKLASPADSGVGAGNGASSYPGSSLQMQLLSPAKSVSINPGAVIALAQITVNKIVDSGSATASTWCFNISPDPNGQSGTVCGPTGIFTGLNTGSYTITESSVSGYAFASGSGTNCVFSGATATASVTAATTPSNATCTFHNAQSTGTLRLIKTVITDNGGNATASDFNLHVKSAGVDVTGSPQAGSDTGTVYTLASGTYTVSEDTPPTGYTQAGVVCDGQNTNSVTVVAGQEKVCTITNDDQQTYIIVDKTVVNDNGGTATPNDFSLTVDGNAVSDGVAYAVNPGTHTAGETLLPGYTAGSWGGDCDANASVTVALGQTKTCTITNNDIAPSLTLVKTVTNNNGGSAVATDWILTATGYDSNSPDAGTYSLSESTGPTGYTQTSLTCDNSVGQVTSVTLGLGENVTCTFVNDDIAPQLTVIKHVINDNGGNKVAADFTMNVSGTNVSDASFYGAENPGTTVTLNAGSYSVDEDNLTGYAKTLSSDCFSTIAVGETKTCTITNNDIAPTLTLVKTVVNNNGGSLLVSQVPLFISGSPAVSGTAYNVSANTLLTASETQQTGYLASVWGGDCASNGTITLLPGENKTCTITNDDIAPVLTFIKVVNNNYGGTLGALDFPLYINGNLVTSGVANTLSANTLYTLTEDQQYGYTGGTFSGDCAEGGTITLAPGDNKTCTITNTDVQPRLTVTKVVTNDNGGTKQVSDFPMFVNSTGVTSGVQNGFNAGTYTVSETNLPGYAATISGDCNPTTGSVTLSVGDVKSCTITNNDQPGTLIVNKVVTNDNGGNATADDFSYQIDGATAVPFEVDGSNSQVVNSGFYTITEPAYPGYSTIYNNCTGVFVPTGGSATCTITNDDDAPGLTLVKEVVTDNGGTAEPANWTLTATGPTGFSGTGPTVTNGASFDAGIYNLSESGPSGYTPSAWNCVGGTQNDDDTVTLALGQSATCTITNDDIAPTLKLVKNVTINSNGNETPANWALTATGTDGFSDSGNSTTFHTVKAGVGYVLSESTVPGYTASAWSCNGGALVGNTLTLGLDDDVTCQITNTDTAPNLTVIKHVSNDNGGNAVVTDFDIELNDVNLTFGAGNTVGNITTYTANPTVSANVEYTLSEIDLPGYIEGSWSCTDNDTQQSVSHPFSLSEGQNVTCEIRNDDVAPTITLNKVVVGSKVSINSFGLTIGATSVNSGQTLTVDANTAYALNEAGLTNYSFTSLTGDIKCPSVLGGTVTLDEDEDLTCTITNTRDTGTITITKDAMPDHSKNFTFTTTGGTLPASFQLDDDVNSPLPRTRTYTVPTGRYSITESLVSGWELTDLSCTDDNGNWDPSTRQANLSVETGENITCTFTNTKYGSLAGRKYHDVDGSGTKQTTESYLDGWTIDLLDANLQLLDSVVTGTGSLDPGQYKFTNLLPGTYYTCERLQSGWVQTDPTSGTQYNGTYCRKRTVTAGQNITGVHFGNRGALSITACKWEDSNGQSEGGNFTPVFGWDMTLGDTTQPTGENGCTTFSNLTPGDYSVSEGETKGWSSADGNTTQRASLTETDVTLDFYNYRLGSLSGSKWDDLDGNGSWDDEPTIPNWPIQLFASDDETMGNQIGEDALTDSDGNYLFTGVEPGDYYVCEVEQDGWTQTSPNFDSAYSRCHSVTVNSGDQLTGLDFGNFRYGRIQGFKYEDKNGNGARDEGENWLNDWEICLNNEDWEGMECTNTYSSEAYGDGYFSFGGLDYGDYTLTEDETDSSYQRTQPESSSYSIPIQSGTGYGKGENFYYFGNAPLTNIHGYKWDDVNGNGRRDCSVFDELFRFDLDRECEDLLGGWTIFLDENGNEQLDGEEIFDITDPGDEHFGWYQFDALLPGSYTICEVGQAGWLQTYPLGEATYCHHITVPNDDELTKNGTFGPEYHFGNVAKPSLTIEKKNDATTSKGPGAIITYTLTVALSGSNVAGVTVTDVPPEGFEYVAGSWTSSKAGVPEPSYSSPGVWELGDMNSGDIITLTYQAKIKDDVDGGNYLDTAWGQGSSTGWGTVLAQGQNSEYLDGVFVSTDVYVDQNMRATGSVDIQGEVLGASTELPATGAETVWLILALSLLFAGLVLILGGKKMKNILAGLITVSCFLFTITPSAQAADPDNQLSVKVEAPISPTRDNDFTLAWSVLDRAARTPVVSCYVKKPSSGSFVQFDTSKVSTKPMGDNNSCHVDSSVMSNQGSYEFYVLAVSGSGSEESSHVTVTYDTEGPDRPVNYSKERPWACRYTIKFKTADDGGKTTSVELFGSKDATFNTDNSTRIGGLGIGSNQEGSLNHDLVGDDCNQNWYYVIRAFDTIGNQSAHLGDEVVNITTVTSSPTTGALVVTSTTGSVLGKDTTTGSDSGEVMGETASPTPPSVEGQRLISGATDAVKAVTSGSRKWWLLAVILAILGGYVYFKKAKTQ